MPAFGRGTPTKPSTFSSRAMWPRRCAPPQRWVTTPCRSALRATWSPNRSRTVLRRSASAGSGAGSTAARSPTATRFRPAAESGLRLAGVAAVQVVENLLRLLVRDRRAEAVLHLLNGLLPRRTIHGRRVTRYVLEAVADDAAARGQVAPGSVLELNRLLAGRRPQQPPGAGQRQRCQHQRCPPARTFHTTSRLTVCTMLSW